MSQQHWSHQHQQCHWTSPPVIFSPPSFLSLVFDRYFSISVRDRQGSGQNLKPLGGRLLLYPRYFLVDPCPIVRGCVYLSMSVYSFFSICIKVSTKLYHNAIEANLPPNLLTCQRSALVLTSFHPIGHSEIHTL